MASADSRKRKNDDADDTNNKKARLTTQTRTTDVVAIDHTKDLDMVHISKTISQADIQREDDEAINDIMQTLKRFMATVRDDLNVLPLETAISLLQCELENQAHSITARSIVHHHLRRALLTRYCFFGCNEDLEKCFIWEEGTYIVVAKGITGREIEQVEELQCAIELIDQCRQGVDIATLDDIIWIAEESIRLYTEGKQVLQQAELLILLGNALIMRYLNHFGELELTYAANKFREAEYLCGGNVPLAYISLAALAHIGWSLATECGADRGVMDAMDYMGKAWAIDNEAFELCRLGTEMAESVVEMSQLQQLHEAIDHLMSSLSCRKQPHPKRLSSLNGVCNALWTRFQWGGNFKDLENGILLNREGLRLESHRHPDRAMWLNNLANALGTRFEQRGAFQDLEESILLHREGLDLRPPPHPDRSMSLNNLANVLTRRFEQKGAFQDLEEYILLHREALDLRPPPHPHRSMSLNNLATGLLCRFQQKGASRDLEESILMHREALDLRPSPHPDRSMSLNNLAATLTARFRQKGAFQDLDECILLHREALELRPSPHPIRSRSLNNLAYTLYARFEQKGAFEDLDECILLHREALELRPSPHPDRYGSLTNLATGLSTRFERKGGSKDLEEAILLYREALDLLPPPHPQRSAPLINLADLYLSCYRRTNGYTDLDQAFHYLESAAQYETGSLLSRFEVSKTWAVSARAHRPSAALNAYLYALKILPLLASVDLTLKERSDVLEHSRGLIGDAAQWAITQNQFETAVIFLSTGRSTFWSQALQLRTTVDEVAAIHSTLAQQYLDISRTLERASHNPEQRFNMKPASNVYVSDSLSTLASERGRVINEIRRIPGFENFLLPPAFPSLQLAARKGPIVFLNASQFGCDAVIMQGVNPVEHVALPNIEEPYLRALLIWMHMSLNGELRFMEDCQTESRNAITDLREFMLRDVYQHVDTSSITSTCEDILQFVMEVLWGKVVHPVVMALGLHKGDPPPRIWWCPSGAFASLPIHAAGIYSNKREAIDCLFQYAISSFITSPQDLLHPLSQISPDCKITAIIEPEASGGAPLPAAKQELLCIKAHVPDPSQLITNVGTEDTHNQIEDVISDIQRSSIVHFGCHGTQNLGSPLDSYLLLSGGKLTMSKIIKECQTSKTATLAYLSACETAKGDKDRPDESLNLVATMMFAGFRSVVGTMWSIFDWDAPIVADIFYGHLFRHGKDAPPDVRDAAYGLHLATAKLREQGRGFQSWVPFVHYGI